MKGAARGLAVLTCLSLSAVPAGAQYGRDQHKALQGLSRVLVIFSEDDHKTDAATFTQMRDSVLSALTQSGLRVARDSADLDMKRDGILDVSLFLGTGVEQVVIDLEQSVVLARTKEPLQLVTWYYEAGHPSADWRSDAPALLMKGVAFFISDWRSANGAK